MRKWLLIISLFLSCGLALAQQDSLKLGYSVQGTVVDAYSGKALESVHVLIPGKHLATVTNADGFFIIKSNQPISSVSVSCLGFKSREVKVIMAEKSPLKIALKREVIEIPEASVISGNPRAIVEAAVERIWNNYCTDPELLDCFYRETLQKRSRYIYVAEAVARMYKSRYDGAIYRDAAALEKSRVLVSQRRSDTLSVKTQGGPALALNWDLVKNTEFLFSPREMDNYRYELQSHAFIGDRLQFVVKMTPVEVTPYPLYNCLLYIDCEQLTFTRLEASMDMSDLNKATQQMLISKPKGLRFTPEECTIQVNYRLENGKIRMQYFRSTMRFACDWRKRLFRTHYTAVNELVVTDVREKAVPIPSRERFRSTEYLSEKAGEFYDADFWADFIIIEPSESLESAIRRLRKQ